MTDGDWSALYFSSVGAARSLPVGPTASMRQISVKMCEFGGFVFRTDLRDDVRRNALSSSIS